MFFGIEGSRRRGMKEGSVGEGMEWKYALEENKNGMKIGILGKCVECGGLFPHSSKSQNENKRIGAQWR